MSQKEEENPLENPILEHAESTRDTNWIYTNVSRFWIGASGGYKKFGRGAIVTEPHTWEESEKHSSFDFVYTSEDSIEDEEVKSLVQRYNPENEFVIIIKKQPHLTATGSEITSTYRVPVDLDTLEQ